MTQYKEWFAVDVKKRAAAVRSRRLAVILKELLANSLDAGAANIELTCQPAKGTRRDGSGLLAFEVSCVDDGAGCADPDILRRVGSSTSHLHAERRGRFGQGLIDVLAIADSAEIRTLRHRLTFGSGGCQISSVKNVVDGMRFDGLLRHGGDGFDDLAGYFDSVILPDGVSVIVNGQAAGEQTAALVEKPDRLSQIKAALALPMPTVTNSIGECISFVATMSGAFQLCGQERLRFAWRMGKVLARLKEERGHGNKAGVDQTWDEFCKHWFRLCGKTGDRYIKVAEG